MLLIFLLFCSCKSVVDNKLFNDFMKDYNANRWKIVVVERGKIKYGDPISGKTIPLFGNRDYIFNTPVEKVDCPSLCFNNSKLLIAKNNYSENIGKLVLIDLKTGGEKMLAKAQPIISPAISGDYKYIAYLSTPINSVYSMFLLNLESGKIDKIVNGNVIHGGVYNTAISWGETNQLFFTDKNKNICIFDVNTKTIIKHVICGYDPVISNNTHTMIYKKHDSKPYTPFVYDIINRTTNNIRGSEIYNATWTPNDKYFLVIRNISKFWKWNEWEKEVLIMDASTGHMHKLIEYEGYEYIDCE